MLKHEATHDPSLVFWGGQRSCIMRNGDAVIKGKTSKKSPAEFHVYNTHGQKIKTIKQLCEHEELIDLLSVIIDGINYVTVSCPDCHKIRLYNMDTAAITEAWHHPKHRPEAMCHGAQGQICVVDLVKGAPVLILDSTTHHFKLKNTVQTNMKAYYDICYIPTVDGIVISNRDPSPIIRAVSLTSQILWEFTGSVDGATCHPHGFVFLQKHEAILAADGDNKRILVLQPESGRCLQTIDVSQHVNIAWQLHLYEYQLILHHQKDRKPKLSYYTVSVSIEVKSSYDKLDDCISFIRKLLCKIPPNNYHRSL